MKKILTLILILIMTSPVTWESADAQARGKTLHVVGYVPGKYVSGESNNSTVLVQINIKDSLIESIEKIDKSDALKLKKSGFGSDEGVVLHNEHTGDFDVIYPGLIDLHNHTKQNNLTVWDKAKGQFANRFEWRAWGNYKKAVSSNMNPWIGYGKPITCAAFRWSELQAMVLGTTYLQGPSSCVSDFSINRVEDSNAYKSSKKGVQGPTDIVLPGEMVFVWNTVRPEMLKMTKTKSYKAALAKGATYEDALKNVVLKHCPKIKDMVPGGFNDVNGADELKVLSNQGKLKEACGVKSEADKDRLPRKFLRYVYWIHKSIAGRKNYLSDPSRAAVIGHLSEGRRNDPYNKLEFDILRLLGLDQEYVNLVHAVGVDRSGFKHMKNQGMGLVWSPYSNLLLYGETADIKAAAEEGVMISIGSDWTPTGSRGILEEMKLARNYVKKLGMDKLFNDEELFKMMTENPAKMINHYEFRSGDGDHGIGTLKPEAMGTLIAFDKRVSNPYTNIVTSEAGNLNLVVVDGKVTYGNQSYLKQWKKSVDMEPLPSYYSGLNNLNLDNYPTPPASSSSEAKMSHLKKLAELIQQENLKAQDSCKFSEKKGLVHQSSISSEAGLGEFYSETGINLDRALDIQLLIGVNLMTQSRNLSDPSNGDPEFAANYFPPLYSCNEPDSAAYGPRLEGFVDPDPKASDEMTENLRERSTRRKSERHGSRPLSMAEDYGLEYDRSRDY